MPPDLRYEKVGRWILVAEDQRIVAKYLKLRLREAATRPTNYSWDVVKMDIRLRGENAWELPHLGSGYQRLPMN